jgi:hypothetical protein
MRTLRIALASLLLVAGCSTAEPGEPRAADQPTTSTEQTDQPDGPASSTEPPPTSSAPRDRPEDIDMAGIDICKVVAGLPRPEYGLEDDRPPLAGTSVIFPGAKQCFANGIPKNLSLTLIAVPDEDAREFVETANAEVTDFEAEGYPLSVLKPAQPENCFGVLDVHDGQLLFISYGMGNPRGEPVTPQKRLCDTVPAIAASAISALG